MQNAASARNTWMRTNKTTAFAWKLAELSAGEDFEAMQTMVLFLLEEQTQSKATWGTNTPPQSRHILKIPSPTGENLHLYREGDRAFGEEEFALGELCLPFLILLSRQQSQLIRAVMDTLSYTELELVIQIFKTLNGEEGILVAGRIADNLGITRSVVVSALKKLESAKIIETRSLGVKGTYIRVLNPLWTKELQKLKV